MEIEFGSALTLVVLASIPPVEEACSLSLAESEFQSLVILV